MLCRAEAPGGAVDDDADRAGGHLISWAAARGDLQGVLVRVAQRPAEAGRHSEQRDTHLCVPAFQRRAET
jgi:hypothetical protein